MRVRQCVTFAPGQPLRMQFPDEFAGVVMVVECDAAEAAELLKKFDPSRNSEEKPGSGSWGDGTRVEFVGGEDTPTSSQTRERFKGRRGVVVGGPTGTMYEGSGDQVYLVQFDDKNYRGQFPKADLREIVAETPTKFAEGSRVQMLGRDDEEVTCGRVSKVDQKPKGTLYLVSYTDDGGNPSAAWMPERYLKAMPEEPERRPAAWCIGDVVERFGYGGVVRAVELDKGEFVLVVQETSGGQGVGAQPRRWRAAECAKVPA